MVGLLRLAQLSPAFSEGGSICHMETPALVAGETSAQTASVLENATGLLEKGRPVLDPGPYCAYELNAAGGRLPESRMRENFTYGSMRGGAGNGAVERTETPAQAKAAGQPKSPVLWPPHQRPTLQLENVMQELPKEQQSQTRNLMRAAWKVKTAEEAEKRMEQIARQLEYDHESAARSLREGMREMFTLQRLQIPATLHKCRSE